MNIIIAGDGEVGFYLAKSLSELNHNITVVDPNSELLKRLEKDTDLLTIAGSSTSPQVLAEANVGSCDLFLAVLHDESINLMSCVLAKKLKATRTVARISNAELLQPKHRDMFRDLGVDELVCPERIAAKEIANLLNVSVATEFFDFSGGLLTMYLIHLDGDSPVAGFSVKELVQKYSDIHVRIVAILRSGETIIPHADSVLTPGDMVYLISRPNQLEAIKAVSGKQDISVKKAMIVGGRPHRPQRRPDARKEDEHHPFRRVAHTLRRGGQLAQRHARHQRRRHRHRAAQRGGAARHRRLHCRDRLIGDERPHLPPCQETGRAPHHRAG